FEFAGKERNDGIHLRRTRHTFGRHFAGADFAQDDVPAFTAFGQRCRLGEGRDVHAARREVFVVARSAGAGEDGHDRLFEAGRIGRGEHTGHAYTESKAPYSPAHFADSLSEGSTVFAAAHCYIRYGARVCKRYCFFCCGRKRGARGTGLVLAVSVYTWRM